MMMRDYYNEIDPYAAQWLRNLIDAGEIPPGDVDERSIENVKPDDLRGYRQCHFFAGIGGWPLALQLAGWPADRGGLWTGSCPCQPFANPGQKKAAGDKRHLWPEMFRLIRECKQRECGPSVLLGEQVESPLGRAWLAAVLADLESVGYAVAAADLCAAGVGAPQRRQRLYWMADADHARWERAERQGQSNQAWTEREIARCESVRPARGHWPPGPREVDQIPLLANGLLGTMGGCKGYGNAIVPQVAAEFIKAYLEIEAS